MEEIRDTRYEITGSQPIAVFLRIVLGGEDVTADVTALNMWKKYIVLLERDDHGCPVLDDRFEIKTRVIQDDFYVELISDAPSEFVSSWHFYLSALRKKDEEQINEFHSR